MSEEAGESRREFLKQAGTVAWATPLILTLAASPAGAQPVSCSPAGTPCGTWSDSLQTCLPLADDDPPFVVCCGTCAQGTGGAQSETFCYCT